MTNLTGPSWPPASGNPPRQLLVLCHGLGADGKGFGVLAQTLHGALPDAVVTAPDAPQRHDNGGPGRQWFSMRNFSLAALGAGIREAAKALDAFIDAELARYRLPANAYALAGFSQGAMMALFTGLRRPVAPRAILAYSGLLMDPMSLRAEMKNHAPVLLVHGEADNVVPVARSREAEAVLRANGVPVESHYTARLGHAIDPAGYATGVEYLRRAFLL